MDWQPIDTAPKDKRIILFCDGMPWIGGWDHCERMWAGAGYGLMEYRGGPTHWMPFPDNPTIGASRP